MKKLSKLEAAFLLLVLAAGFVTILRVHTDYTGLVQDIAGTAQYVEVDDSFFPYPYHGDEWGHMAMARLVAEQNRWPDTNPYTYGDYYFSNSEAGSDITLAVIWLMSGGNLVKGFFLLPAAFWVLNAFFMFLMLHRITGKFWLSVSPLVPFMFAASNVNILGNWFLVPSVQNLWLVFLAVYLWVDFIETGSIWALSSAIFVVLVSFVSYPLHAAVIFLIGLSLMADRRYRPGRQTLRAASIAASLLVLAGVAYLLFVYRQEFIPILLRHLLTTSQWTAFNVIYSFLDLFSWFYVALLLVGIGAIALSDRRLVPMVIAFALLLANFVWFNLTLTSVVFPYQRNIYLMTMLACIPIGAGIYWISRLTRWKGAATAALLLLFFIASFPGYMRIDNRDLVPYRLISDEYYDAVIWMEQTYGKSAFVIADDISSFIIYPVAGMISLSPQNSFVGGDEYGLIVARTFFSTSCEGKYELIQNYDTILDYHSLEPPRLVFSRFPLSCDFLKPVRSSSSYVIYEISY